MTLGKSYSDYACMQFVNVSVQHPQKIIVALS